MRCRFCALLFLFLLGSCKTTYKIQTGDDAYELKRYAQAIPLYEQELKSKNSNLLYTNMRLAECHAFLRQHSQALPYYRQSIKQGGGYEVWLKYAEVLMADEQYENARKALTKIKKDYGSSPAYSKMLKQLNLAEDASTRKKYTYLIEPLDLNTKQTEYGYFDYQGAGIYTSDKPTALGKQSQLSGEQHTDIFGVDVPLELQRLLDKINTSVNESSLVINQAGSHAIFTRCGEEGSDKATQKCQLFESIKENGVWSVPTLIPFCAEEDNYLHPAFFNNDIGVIFSSDRPDGMGDFDLWLAYKRGDQWMEPSLLPAGINTESNEVFPTIESDTLYFSSNGLAGYGALDIYKSIWIGNGWMEPENIGSPFNSAGDDFAYQNIKDADKNVLLHARISTNRKGGKGADDILEISRYAKDIEEPVVSNKKQNILITGKVYGIQYVEQGDTRKRQRVELDNALITYAIDGKTNRLEQLDNQRFEVTVHQAGKYEFKARSSGYLANSKVVKTEFSEGKTARYLVEIELEPINYNEEIVLENIYYDFDKWDIRADALPSLDKLATLLRDNPDIKIELSSHTDCRGQDDYNYELSQRRAQSATNYIIQNGISAKRIVAKGYGKSRLKVDCPCQDCTEEEHQINRRTAFTIIK